ncbi:MAG: DsbE family thiol:disulfide interchange protein [Alphaproteobacteria bacterium]|nr:DsbE family thiol:disulfide interchange protein [Alphaproteobacteria bacterium]
MDDIQEKRSPRRWTAILPVVIVALLVGAFAKRLMDVEGGQDPQQVQSVLLDTPVPDIDLPPLPDRGAGLTTADLKRDVSLVNVWGSWCVACLSEHPLLMDVAEQNDIPLHGIAWRDEPSASVRWLARNGDPYDLIGQDPVSEAAIAFGVTGAPETFVVDADGIIRYKHIGPITPDAWSNTIAPLVEQLRQ